MTEEKIIVGIDPGTDKSAIVAIQGMKIILKNIMPNEEMLNTVASLKEMIRPEVIVWCEMIECQGMPVGRETFTTVLWIGKYMLQAELVGVPFHLLTRREEKLHLCGSMRAKDANIRQALIDIYGEQGTKKNPGGTYGVSSHCWAALAVAETGRAKSTM